MAHLGAHDSTLVALSVLIAAAASYTALDLGTRMRASDGWGGRGWLFAAALAMGGGIWSMHFVAMLAFSLPGVEVGYDLTLTLLSLAMPIVVTAASFIAASRRDAGLPTLVVSGLLMGLGIAGMHYTGMAAMRMQAALSYDGFWVATSILIAIGAATVALWLAFKRTGFLQRLLAAAVMGLAVSGMHYAAMQGASFAVDAPIDHAQGQASLGQTHLALWVTGTTFLILFLSLLAAMFDRHLANRAAREAVALRESEERFRLLLRGVTDYAIFMLDIDGRVANWNAGAQRIKGYGEEEIVGSHLSRFYIEEDRQAGVPERALATAAREGRFEAEGWRLRKDGSRFWANVIIDPIRDDAGTLVGFAKVTRDITERREAHEALERTRDALAQSQKMEALGKLTGGVAHDFNNLLTAVMGSLELLKKKMPPDPALTRLVDNAMQGAQRGAVLTQRMLAFARRQDLRPEAVDLADLVRGMADLLQRSTGLGVTIETRFPEGLAPVLVDSNQLELALLNLTVNARDAMPKGGTITIAARDAAGSETAGLPPGRYVCIAVIDRGEGMDEATLARAQEPFFTTKGVGKGTGLGLSMVHGLAEQSQGRLALRSRPGEGTTAEIVLPVATAPVGDALPAASLPPARGTQPATILVVDDDPLVLENICAMLEDLGHRVVRAASGEEGLEQIRRTPGLDLVITDQAMPGLTGVQLAQRIAAEWPGLPVVLASGYADLPSGTPAGLQRLSKPFDQAALARKLEAVLRDESIAASVR